MRASIVGAVVVACSGCGDQLERDVVDDAVSGAQLKVEWTFYGDGSRQPAPGAYYDIELAARCSATRWADGKDRCAPAGDPAFYVDAACEALVGRGDSIEKPRFFLGYDQIGGERLPARLYRAGPPVEPVAQIYEKIDGTCQGPFSNTTQLPYYDLIDEIRATDLVALEEREVGAEDARIGLRVLEGEDGSHVPLGLHDRVLDAPCRAVDRPDGAVCEPEVRVAYQYLDPACELPAIIVFEGSPVPAVVTRGDATGCPTYFGLGPPSAGPVYQRAGAACAGIALGPNERAYPLGAPLALAALERSVEDVAGPRLQRIALAAGALRVYDEHMFDTATRGACSRTTLGDAERCLPDPLAPARILFSAGCALEVPIVELREPTCAPVAFAITSTNLEPELHAIGDRITTPLFTGSPGACSPYTPQAGTSMRALGPALPADTFVGGHVAGER